MINTKAILLSLNFRNMTNVSFIILNRHEAADHIHLLQKIVNIPVYQDRRGTQGTTWGLLNGNKDDFLLYDNCGRLNYHLRMPYSFLGYPFVR